MKTKTIRPGTLALRYLAEHHGFDRRLAYGDLFRAIRLPNGRKLPEGTALQQRLGDLIRRKKIRVYHEKKRGCIVTAFYWLPTAEANAFLKANRA